MSFLQMKNVQYGMSFIMKFHFANVMCDMSSIFAIQMLLWKLKDTNVCFISIKNYPDYALMYFDMPFCIFQK